MGGVLEKNIAIIYNECQLFAQQNCLPTTPSGQPIQISGNGFYIISGPVPNPQVGIINLRFLNQSNLDANIQSVINKSNSIFKSRSEKKISTNGDGMQSKGGNIGKLINEIRQTKSNITDSNAGDLRTKYINDLISITVKDILKKKLITPIKLPPATLNTFATQIVQKTITGESNYGYYDLNLLIVQTILKTINF